MSKGRHGRLVAAVLAAAVAPLAAAARAAEPSMRPAVLATKGATSGPVPVVPVCSGSTPTPGRLMAPRRRRWLSPPPCRVAVSWP